MSRPPAETRQPVMADVAARAGVSHQTVSRVLNDHPYVTPETRARVTRAIAELGYRRNPAARALASRRSRVLGVVTTGTSQFGPANTLLGMQEQARATGYFVNFVSLAQVDRASMQAALEHLGEAGVDGIVVLAPVQAAVDAAAGLSAEVPLVIVEGRSAEGDRTVVDQVLGGRLATRHLLDLGHRTVHHVRGADDWLDANARLQGWRAELEDRSAPVPEVRCGDWSAASGHAAGRLLAADPEVTAVFVANDQMAVGLVLALSEAGRSVPEAVSVVGFDDIPEAAFLRPPLTTVRQDFPEMGRRCVQRLTAMIDREPVETAREVSVAPELVVRASTGPPPR